MRILGIDPGFERLGIAVLEKNTNDKKETVLFSECFKTSPKFDFSERLFLIGKETGAVIRKYKPEVLAIETLFLNTNQKTAMRVAEARGVVMYEARKSDLRIFEFSPPEIKGAVTGYGKASKEEIIKMVKMLVETKTDKIRLNKQNSPIARESDDELDAIAVAITAFARIRTNLVIHR